MVVKCLWKTFIVNVKNDTCGYSELEENCLHLSIKTNLETIWLKVIACQAHKSDINTDFELLNFYFWFIGF